MLATLINIYSFLPDVYMDDTDNMICQIQYLFNNNMIKIFDIYVRTNGNLL